MREKETLENGERTREKKKLTRRNCRENLKRKTSNGLKKFSI